METYLKKLFCSFVVTLNILFLICNTGCRSVNPKLQGEYIRDSISIGLKTVINDSRQAVQKFMLDEKVQGASVALVDCDGILWTAGFGYNGKKQKTPVTPETIFAIMSITKVFTKTVVMFAIQDGLVELDVPITEYLPDFSVNSRFEEAPQKKITLRAFASYLPRHGVTGAQNRPLGPCLDAIAPAGI